MEKNWLYQITKKTLSTYHKDIFVSSSNAFPPAGMFDFDVLVFLRNTLNCDNVNIDAFFSPLFAPPLS